jgi:hypothetical protein
MVSVYSPGNATLGIPASVINVNCQTPEAVLAIMGMPTDPHPSGDCSFRSVFFITARIRPS